MNQDISDPPEYDIYLPVRCLSCGFMISKFQQKYEELLFKSGVNIDQLSIYSAVYIEMMKIFNIPDDRFCCRRHFLSPICIPYSQKPICSISVGRESLTAETRPKHIFTSRTFDDISNRRNTTKSINTPADATELDPGKDIPQLGIIETTKIETSPVFPVKGSILFPIRSVSQQATPTIRPVLVAGAQPIQKIGFTVPPVSSPRGSSVSQSTPTIRPITPKSSSTSQSTPIFRPIQIVPVQQIAPPPVVITGLSNIVKKTNF